MVQNLIPARSLQVVICVTEVTGSIYSFQLGGQSNCCATHTDRHKNGWNFYWLCYPYAINIL